MTPPSERAYLLHVRDALDNIEAYTAGGRAAFLASRLVQDAVIRNLEIVGEAVKRLGEPTRALAPEIPWKRIAGMRDVLIHDYFGVDLEVVWGVVEVHVAPLRAAVERLLTRISSDP